MIKCQNCGTFVPAEKAFCPNCSEPMEVEEKSNRNHSFSSDMMSTIRDDPEKYKELLKLKASVKKQAPAPPSPPPAAQVYTPPPPALDVRQPAAPPVAAGQSQWQAAPLAPAPQSNARRNLILGIGVVALLAVVIVLLFVFKVI